mgnify:CR=1 FL=1|tara:strand:- start:14697 stop:15491 length:795 start_codon:yes stop_codon:yes gene_type:complete
MNTFIPGSDITLTFDMVDDESETIDPVSATFDVFDHEGVQLVTGQAITVVGSEDQLETVIDATHNTITGAEGARSVIMNIVAANGNKRLTKTYLLSGQSFLVVPEESGMTIIQSEMLSVKMAQSVLEVWNDEDEKRKSAALRESWTRLSRIPFSPWRDFEVPDSDVPKSLINGDFALNQLSMSEWLQLPANFKGAIKRAQLIEAAVLLDGDPTWDRRQDGLISKTVGESSEMFSSKKAAFSTISPKSQREISAYIRRRIVIGRA